MREIPRRCRVQACPGNRRAPDTLVHLRNSPLSGRGCRGNSSRFKGRRLGPAAFRGVAWLLSQVAGALTKSKPKRGNAPHSIRFATSPGAQELAKPLECAVCPRFRGPSPSAAGEENDFVNGRGRGLTRARTGSPICRIADMLMRSRRIRPGSSVATRSRCPSPSCRR